MNTYNDVVEKLVDLGLLQKLELLAGVGLTLTIEGVEAYKVMRAFQNNLNGSGKKALEILHLAYGGEI